VIFHRGETIICSVVVTDSSGTSVDPSTSMTVSIYDNFNGKEVTDQAMSKDSVGHYHYDWTSTADNLKGLYSVLYKAVDGSRISIAKSNFELE